MMAYLEPIRFTALPQGWRCVFASWFANDPDKPFEISEVPAIGVAVVRAHVRGEEDPITNLDFVVVTGNGLELWEQTLQAVNSAEVGFLEPGQKLEDVYSRELLDKAVEQARKNSEYHRKQPAPTRPPK